MALPAVGHAADEVPVLSYQVDLSETRATGHNEFRTDGSGVRVWTEGNTSTDKAAGYFDVDKSLASVGEPSMSWLPNGAQTLRPSVQLKTDFDGNGSIDGILVGEPTYADGSVLYGTDWWLSNGSAQFVKDAAPSHDGGSGSSNHGTLAQWRAAFADAKVIQGGWSLGSGVKGDGVIQAIVIGAQPYYFVKSVEPTTAVKHKSDVDLSETRAKGHNVFREIGGVRVTTDASDCQDPNPAGGVYCANKAAGYFPAPLALSEAGEPSMDYVRYSGLRPSVQLVTDFDNDGTADAILVGETVYGRDWWVPGSAAQFVKDGAPSHTGGSGSDNHGSLPEWRAAFPDAKILRVGWSLGSGVEGDGVINAITVGLTKYTFSGANRAPVADDKTVNAESGQTIHVTLTATDADGDTLTYSSSDPGVTVVGDQLTYTVPEPFSGAKVLNFQVSDPDNASDAGTVTVNVTQANRKPSASDLAAATTSGGTLTVTLAATDPDGDTLTYASPHGTVVGNKLTYSAPKDFTGTKVLAFTATDPGGLSDGGTVTVTVNKASSTSSLKVVPGKVTTKSKHVRAKVAVASAGVVAGGTVEIYDGDTKVGTGVLDAAGNVKIAVTKKLSKGKHTFTAVFTGTGSAATSQASVVVKVKKAKKKK